MPSSPDAAAPAVPTPAAPPQAAAPRLMHVGELAERVNLSHRTVRYYDDQGLLTATARSAGNYRLYSEADVERMLLIRQMKPLGFSLEQMAQVLRIVDAVAPSAASPAEGAPGVGADADVDVLEFIDQARTRREKLAGQVAAADELIARLERVRDHIVRAAP